MADRVGSVIIDDRDMGRAVARPGEADSPLIIDTYAVLLGAVAIQAFQSIARRRAEIIKNGCSVQHRELAFRGRLEVHKPWNAPAFEQGLRQAATE